MSFQLHMKVSTICFPAGHCVRRGIQGHNLLSVRNISLHSSETPFQLLLLRATNMMLAQPTVQSTNTLPETGPTRGNSTVCYAFYLPKPSYTLHSCLGGWEWYILLNILLNCAWKLKAMASPCWLMLILLPLDQSSNLQGDDNRIGAWSYGFTEINAPTIPSNTYPLIPQLFPDIFNLTEHGIPAINALKRNSNKLSAGPSAKPKMVAYMHALVRHSISYHAN